MKKFVIILLSFITLISLFAGCEEDQKMDNKRELFSMGVYDDENLIKSITDVYIPHTTFPILSRVISSNDITEFFEIPGIESVVEGNYIFKTQLRKFVLAFNDDGELIDMLNIGNKDISKKEFVKIKSGYSFKEVSEIDPSVILYKQPPLLLTEDPTLLETPISEHILSDGCIGIVEYQEREGEYVVKRTYISTMKLDKNMLKTLEN